MADDFYREIAAYLDADTRDLVVASLDDAGHAAFVVDRVRAAIVADPRLGRPARAVGPAADGRGAHPGPAGRRRARRALRAARRRRRPPGLDLAAIGRMFTRITERHAERMAELGLDS